MHGSAAEVADGERSVRICEELIKIKRDFSATPLVVGKADLVPMYGKSFCAPLATKYRPLDCDKRQPISTAKRGLITSSMIARRSSNGMNADSIALIVNRARSVQP